MPAPQHRPSHPNVQDVNDPSIPQKREVRDKVPAPVRPIAKDENRNNEPKRREEDKENRQPHAHHPHPHGHHAHHPSQPIHHGHHGAPPPPPPPPPPPRQPHHENGGRAHGHRPDAAHGQGRPHVEPTKPAPMSEEKAIEKAKAMLGERIQQLGGDADPAKWRVGIHKGTMEFTFPYPRNPPLSDTLQIISQSPISGAKCECGVSFRTSHTVVRIPCRTTPTLEVMIPMEKNKLAMVHADMICFGPNEVELAAKLYIHGNSENKVQSTQPQQAGKKPQKADGKQDNDTIPEGDMPLEDVREKLVELGVQVFMPAVLSPALKEKEAATNNKAKCFNDASVEKLWAGIGGYLEVKASVKQTITLPLLRPDLFTRMALLARKGEGKPKCTAGVLFTGPPGVGKTTMAKVAAHAAGVPLIYVPVESIMSKWYGEAEQRLRKVFDLARKIPRSALFLDELDAFAGSRDRQMHEATRRILSVLLRQLDGLENENVETETAQSQQKSFFMVVVGATNRPEDLDAALMSRFDQSIEFPLPSESERAAIFGTYAAVLNSSDLNQLAKASPGCAGRDIVEICRQAERIWLYKLLNSESGIPLDMSASQLRPPPVSVYLEAVSNHKAGNAPQ